MRIKTIKPPVKSNKPFTVNIVQSDHQLITVKHDGKSYTKTFTIPAGKVLNYKSYVALTDDDGYYVGRIKEVIDLDSNSTTISASEARPIIHTVTVEQYQLQDINVHLTEPGNIIRFEDETTSYSFTAEDKTKYTSDCSTRLVNYDPGTTDHPGPGDIQENFTIAADTNPQRNENVQVLIYQSPHQTITVDHNGTKHTEAFIIKRRDIVSATIKAEAGYKAGILNHTKVRATNFDNIIFKASAASKAKKRIRIKQKHHQTITATYKGKTFETSFEAFLGDKIQFSVEADPGWIAGTLNVDADYTVVGLEPLEVTVTDAEPIMYTITPIQTPHQTIYIKYDDVRSSTPVRVPNGTRAEFEIEAEAGYDAGTLDKTYAIIEGKDITVSATPAEIRKYTLTLVFDPEAHTRLNISKDGTVFGSYTKNTTLKFPHGSVLTFTLTMEEGYEPISNPNSITMDKDKTLVIQGTTKKQFTITIVQSPNQTIYAMYKGVKKTSTFVVEYGDSCTFGIETSDPNFYEVGSLSSTEFTNIKENKTVTATPAKIKPIDLTNYVVLKYPYPNTEVPYDVISIGIEPNDTTSLYFKTIDKLREDDYNYAENAQNIIAAKGAFTSARLVTKFPVIKLKENIHDLTNIFAGCSKLTWDELKRNLYVWKLSGDLILEGAFSYNKSLEYIDMDTFKNSKIISIRSMFRDDNRLTTIDNINKLNVTNLISAYYAFSNCSALTSLDVSAWDIGNVTNMNCIFNNCTSLTSIGDVSKWNTSNVKDMFFAFNNCSALTSLDVSAWDIGNVTNMYGIFHNCSSLTSIDVSRWDTSNVTRMGNMFYNCNLLTSLDVSKWDTSKVTDMESMFNLCSKLTSLDVSKWDTSKVTNIENMFSYTTLTTIDVSKWDTSKVTRMAYVFEGCNYLTSLDVSKWDTSKVTRMGYMFNGCNSLTSIDVSKWNTSNVSYMAGVFNNCNKLTSLDISEWDTSNATDIANLFADCSSLTSIDVSKWNTSNVTNMDAVFAGCNSLTSIDVSKWDTSNVTSMIGLFSRCTSLSSLDLSNWNTSKVTSMDRMFNSCSNLTTLDLSNWNTSKVTSMDRMFNSCSNLTNINGILDLKSCTRYDDMFLYCPNLTSVRVKNLPTDIDSFCTIAKIDKSKVVVIS